MKLRTAKLFQYLFLGIFLVLFVYTEYRGKDEISIAVNSFFRADPLVVVSYLLAKKTLASLLIPGILLIVFTILLGRFFCGWMCPLGTIIDLTTTRIRKSAPIAFLKSTFKYYLLFSLLVVALFNINLAGVFDPLAILIRALTFFFYPLLGYTFRQGWVDLYAAIGDKRDHLDFLYTFLKSNILPFRETFYPLAFVSLIFFAFILFLERFEERNWCRNICPLGTLLGLLSRFSLFRRLPPRLCSDCKDCKDVCPTSFDKDIVQKQDCIVCMECTLKCTFSRAQFSFGGISNKGTGYMPERRVLLVSLLSGFALSKVFSFSDTHSAQRLLRPPGVTEEEDFLKKCVRCGECMKVCLKNALYPSVLQGGVHGIFAPVLIPRKGYCEYNCNLCGQVCPTGAIPNLPVQQKKKAIIGLAVVDKNHCLPYAKKMNCIVCEEHCPIPTKAIRFEVLTERDYAGKSVVLKKPYVVEELCNGCGICEYACPLEGKPAIEVFSKKNPPATSESRYGSF